MKKLLLITLCFICIKVNSQIQVSTITPTFNGSGGVTIDDDGNVYIADFGDTLGGPDTDGVPNNVMKLDTNLNLSIYANDFTGASGNEIDANGVLFQADIRDNAIYRVINGSRQLFASGLILPVGIAVDSNGNFFACNCGNNTISKITPNGTVTTFSSGNGLLACPNGMTIDENDNLYIVNFSNPFIVKIEPNGTTTNIGSTLAGNGHIDYDAMTNNLYIASFGANLIHYLDLDNLASGVNTLAGTGVAGNNDGPAMSSTFSAPNGIAVSKTGDSIYVNSSATLNNTNLNPQYVRLLTNVLSTLSTEEFEAQISKIKTYPNPANNTFIIESYLFPTLDKVSMSIWDMNGRTVKKITKFDSLKTKKLTVDIASLNPGIYFYSIKSGKKKLKLGKLIKK